MSNAQADTQTVTNQKPAVTFQPRGAAKPGEMPVAKRKGNGNLTVADLTKRVRELESQLAPTVKKPVSDAELAKAFSALQGANKEKPETLNLSLSSVLGFVPLLTDPQKSAWKAVKDPIQSAYVAKCKRESGEAIALARRAIANPKAFYGQKIRRRKSDGQATSFSMRGRGFAKPAKGKAKGKGKNGAKPAQIAAKMPAAGNAAKPATV